MGCLPIKNSENKPDLSLNINLNVQNFGVIERISKQNSKKKKEASNEQFKSPEKSFQQNIEITMKGVTQSDTMKNQIPEKINNMQKIVIKQGILVQQRTGDPFSFYEIVCKLGQGSFGEVFKVSHKVYKSIRAMKVINKIESEMNEQEEKSIINEIKILKTLDHPNIIKVYEYFNTQGKIYIITELCTGGELFDRIAEVRFFKEKIAIHIMKQILSAVQFCHSNNVVHRDLKPENILIETIEERNLDYFNIKVIDFGTSEIKLKNTMLNKQIGTPFYIAPEVLNYNYNEKCDLWSCGVIMYILLCGCPPFYGENDEEIFKKVKEGRFSLDREEWDEISDEGKDLIKQLLNKDIDLRISAEQALRHPWLKRYEKLPENQIKINNEVFKNAIENMKNFHATHKLQQAALAFIVHHQTKTREVEQLKEIFMMMNEKNDGHLTKTELIKGINKFVPPNESVKFVDNLMLMIDVDQNGFIEYEEFLRASQNKDSLLTLENLKHVFNIFDRDKSGAITIEEIKQTLGVGNEIEESVWSEIIQGVDTNGDGEIQFDEFAMLMYKIIFK